MSLIRSIKNLVELAAVRYTLPQSKVASEAYARPWKQFVFAYQPRHSGWVADMIERHGVIWAQQGKTCTVRRAKRDAGELKAMAGLRALNAALKTGLMPAHSVAAVEVSK